MKEGAIKSSVQTSALAVTIGGLILVIALALINTDLLEPPVGTVLGLIILAAYILHTLGMLISAIQNKHVAWAVGIFVFGPLVSIIYFVAKYDTRHQTISATN